MHEKDTANEAWLEPSQTCMIGLFAKSVQDVLFPQKSSTIDIWHIALNTEAVGQRCSLKKPFLEISEKSQENICIRVS